MGAMLAALQKINEDAAEAAAAPMWSLLDSEFVDNLRAAYRLTQIGVALQLRLVQQATANGIPSQQGHRSVAGWLRSSLLLDPRPAREMAERAAALRDRPVVQQALLDGRVDVRQAAVIAAAMNALPETLAAVDAMPVTPDAADSLSDDSRPSDDRTLSDNDRPSDDGHGDDGHGNHGHGNHGRGDDDGSGDASTPDDASTSGGADGRGDDGSPPTRASCSSAQIVAEAESALIDRADQFPAYKLRQLGERILAHVAPEIAERAEEIALARQEARAYLRRGFTISLPVDGMVRLSGVLGVEEAAALKAALEPLCTPKPNDDRTPAQRRADALVDICQLALHSDTLPEHGGEPSQLAITVAYDPLTRRLGIGTLDTGDRLSAETVRRLACDARVLPLILGSDGQVLDAGRTCRLATKPLRRALTVRDVGCRFPGCDVPPRWTDAHHIQHWETGGPTNLNNLVLLCRRHHRLIHHPTAGWQIRPGTDGHPDFIPPPWINPGQDPQRNLFHPRN
jgi:hypothetical protein